MSNDLIYNGTSIRDREEKLNLTDMWRAAGADPSKQPAKWRDLPSTKDFVGHIADVTLRKSESELFKVQNGGWTPGTWAHWQIGLAYAKYLSPEFHAWCNSVVRAYMDGKLSSGPTLAERRVRVMELNAANRTMDHIVKTGGRRAAIANLTEVYAKAGLRIDMSHAEGQGDLF